MKTLRDLSEYLKTRSTAQVEAFDKGKKTTFSLDMWSNDQRNSGLFDLRLVADGQLGEAIANCTFLKLQEMIDQYESWRIRPMDVAANNWYQSIKEWVETDEETYDEMLCVLPPDYHRLGMFAVGEPYTHAYHDSVPIPIYHCFKKDNQNRYWTQIMSIDELKKEN